MAAGDLHQRTAPMTAEETPPPGGTTATVRRIVVLLLLLLMVQIAAAGVSGLLARLFAAAAPDLARTDTGGLALNLAFTVIAMPLTVVLWVLIRRSLRHPGERSSTAWGLYLAAVRTIALVAFTIPLILFLSALVAGEWLPLDLAGAVTWLTIWAWHTLAARSPATAPTRLVAAAPVLGTVFGVLLTAGGSVAVLIRLFDGALRRLLGTPSVGTPIWEDLLRLLVWAVAGVVVWWWHWRRQAAAAARTGLAAVALAGLGGFLFPAFTIGGGGTVLYVLLRLAADRSDGMAAVLEPLSLALALLLVGAVLWTLHWRILAQRGESVRRAARLLSSGVALIAAAIGVGVLVNATLGALAAGPIVGERPRTLLVAALAALLAGGPAWWTLWRPRAPVERHGSGRRVYLVVVFGVSALVALITLIVIGFRIFEYALDGVTGQGLLDEVRAPVGLLSATALVAGYHFALWMRDRGAEPTDDSPASRVRRVYLVAGSGGHGLADRVRQRTGASVTLLTRRDADATSGLSGDDVALAVAGADASAVLVLAGPGDRLEVLPLEGVGQR